MSFVPYIDWAAHVAGLVGGIFCGMWLFGGACKTPAKRILTRYAGMVFLAGFSALGLAYIFLVIQPPKELLEFCSQVVKPSFPSYKLKCYGN